VLCWTLWIPHHSEAADLPNTGRNQAVLCPALIEYGPAFQKLLADEVRSLAEGSSLAVAMQDYLALRDQLRDCQVKIVLRQR